MVEQEDVQQVQAPSKKAIAKATAIALAAAVVILFTTVLPAEYGIDPLKTGKALHLTDLAKATEAKTEPKAAFGARPTAAPTGIYTAQPTSYKTDSEDLSLMPGDGVEIKYHMQKGAEMVYSWKANGKVAFEFHGEPDNKPNKDYFESYELNDKAGADHFYGAFTAPTTVRKSPPVSGARNNNACCAPGGTITKKPSSRTPLFQASALVNQFSGGGFVAPRRKATTTRKWTDCESGKSG